MAGRRVASSSAKSGESTTGKSVENATSAPKAAQSAKKGTAKKGIFANFKKTQGSSKKGAQQSASKKVVTTKQASSNTLTRTSKPKQAKQPKQESDWISSFASKLSGSKSDAYSGWKSLTNPLWCYHGFRLAVLALTVFGLIMVFSSSTVTSYSAGASPFSKLLSQGAYCIIGLIAGFACMMVPVKLWKRLSFGVMLAAIALQALTFTPLGLKVNGNAGWIKITSSITVQPAEFMKFAICLWLPAALYGSKERFEKSGLIAYVPPAIIYAIGLALVLGGKDLGTAMIIVFIGVVAFLVAGFPMKWMGIFAGVMVALVAILVVSSPNRMQRILAAYGSCSEADAQSVCYQSTHARYAIASGGLFGVGLGNSREKWNYLPEAHNDFIYAIIGEETGFIGAVLVILLFVVLGWCMIMLALQIKDRYVSMVLMCVTVWIVGQALVNIGVVVGVFPVLGVPMPYVSAGGSSMVMCLMAAGVVIGMMREQPQIQQEGRKA